MHGNGRCSGPASGSTMWQRRRAFPCRPAPSRSEARLSAYRCGADAEPVQLGLVWPRPLGSPERFDPICVPVSATAEAYCILLLSNATAAIGAEAMLPELGGSGLRWIARTARHRLQPGRWLALWRSQPAFLLAQRRSILKHDRINRCGGTDAESVRLG